MNIEETKNPRFEFHDLSFSGIVNIIDTDEKIGKEFIIEVYNEIQKQKKIVEELERKLHNEESHLRSLEKSIDLTFHHLKWKKPMAFIIEKEESNEIIVVSDNNITLEKNVR